MGFAHAYARVTLEARRTTYEVGGTVLVMVQKVAKTNTVSLYRATQYVGSKSNTEQENIGRLLSIFILC